MTTTTNHGTVWFHGPCNGGPIGTDPDTVNVSGLFGPVGSSEGQQSGQAGPSGGGVGSRQASALNNLPTPTWIKATIPGTNYCGPGGSRSPTDRVDSACAAHDKCYENAGVSFLNNIGWPKTPQQSAAIQACDAALAGAIDAITWPTSNEQGEATLVTTYFNFQSGYNLHPFLVDSGPLNIGKPLSH